MRLARRALAAALTLAAALAPATASAQQAGVPSNVWSTFGNRGAVSPAFLGTTDFNALRIGTDGIPRILIDAGGSVQIGSEDNPSDLDIFGNLNVSGVVTGRGGAVFGSTSDYASVSSTGLLRFDGGGNYGVRAGRYVFQALGNSDALTGTGLLNSGSALELVGASSSAVFSVDYATGDTDIAGSASVGGNADVAGAATVGGSLGVGGQNADPTSYALYVNGRLRSNGINELSDARMKRDVETYGGALGTVLRLRGVRYEWRREEHPALALPEGVQVGLIAQEVEAVVPEVVHTDADGVKSVEYAHLVPVLVEAVKAQQALIERQAEALERMGAELAGVRQALASAGAPGAPELRATSAPGQTE